MDLTYSILAHIVIILLYRILFVVLLVHILPNIVFLDDDQKIILESKSKEAKFIFRQMQRVAVAEYAEINGAKKVNEYTA